MLQKNLCTNQYQNDTSQNAGIFPVSYTHLAHILLQAKSGPALIVYNTAYDLSLIHI